MSISVCHWLCRATAGLRLLNGTAADAILREVDTEIAKSELLVTHSDVVSILSGTDEGVFGWFTLNFLLERLRHLRPPRQAHKTAVTLDLGGGSTQITLLDADPEINNHGDDYAHTIDIFGERVRLYTHRFDPSCINLHNGHLAILATASLLLVSASAVCSHQKKMSSQ